MRQHPLQQAPCPSLGERFVEVAALGRLHARGAPCAAGALGDQAVGVAAELLEAQERGARDPDAAGVAVVDEDRRPPRSGGGGWWRARRYPSGRTSRSAAAPRSGRARRRAARPAPSPPCLGFAVCSPVSPRLPSSGRCSGAPGSSTSTSSVSAFSASGRSESGSSSNHRACVEKLVCGQVERHEVDLRVVGEAPALVGEHGVGDARPRRRRA